MTESGERKRKRGGGKRTKRGVRCNGVERALLTPRKRRRVVVVRTRPRKDWADMPDDILAEIFRRLSLLDPPSASNTCMDWADAAATCAFLSSPVLDLRGWNDLPDETQVRIWASILYDALAIAKHSLKPFPWSSIIFPKSIVMQDMWYLLIARCSPMVRHLQLPQSQQLSLRAVAAALPYWPHLESLCAMLHPAGATRMLGELAAHCRRIRTLDLNLRLGVPETTAIFQGFPELREVVVKFNAVSKEAVLLLGSGCRGRLQRLDISHSFIVDEKDTGIFSSRRLQLSEDEILEVSSCVREFGYCVWTDCQECRKYYYHGATAPGPWYRYWSLHW